MPVFGFARKEQPQPFARDITDKEDLDEQVFSCRKTIKIQTNWE